LAALLPDSGLADAIDLQRRDFFDLSAPAIGRRKGLVALNPPYGRRLGKPEATPRLIGEILRKLQRDFRGWRMLVVLPEKRLIRQVPFSVQSRRVMHGGRPVWVTTGNVPS
jgi:putative N6-adenine-specific DNA methylase